MHVATFSQISPERHVKLLQFYGVRDLLRIWTNTYSRRHSFPQRKLKLLLPRPVVIFISPSVTVRISYSASWPGTGRCSLTHIATVEPRTVLAALVVIKRLVRMLGDTGRGVKVSPSHHLSLVPCHEVKERSSRRHLFSHCNRSAQPAWLYYAVDLESSTVLVNNVKKWIGR